MRNGWKRYISGCLLVICCLLAASCMPAESAVVSGKTQIRAEMDRAFEDGDTQVKLTIARTFSTSASVAKSEATTYAEELLSMLEESALAHGKVMSGSSYTYTIAAAHNSVTYCFDISPQLTKKVTVVKNEKAAYRQALKALKNRDYSTCFYADGALYYDTFVLALQHHPEYNYDLKIWKSTDGTFGYKLGDELSTGQTAAKMKQANAAANTIISRVIKSGMTKKEKLQALHDYLVKHCVYDERTDSSGYDDAYTAYGCLVNGQAVCQGYAGAFNLLAAKAGICSISVSGYAGGGSHAWNYIKDGKNYRYIDVTWDDPVPDQGSDADVWQKYFYRTQAQLSKTHTWNKSEHAKKYVNFSKS